jgi:lipid II:glycine glycyltransferase (peptidoglycan interpeptide bridge formation enzyme)
MARDERDVEDFLQLYLDMARVKDFAAEDPDDVRPLLRWLAKEEGRGGLLLARKDAKLIGGAMIVRSGRRCWYILGASSKDGAFSAGHLLQWRAIQWAKERGCREYDLGGYREGATGGPAFFKRGFCDNVVHFPPPHRYVASETRHRTSEFISRVRRSLTRFPRS